MTEIKLTPGTRLFGADCTTEVIVVIAPATPLAVTIGAIPPSFKPIDRKGESESARSEGNNWAMLGKRYVDEDGSLEVLCTKSGSGVVALNGKPLDLKASKSLPASD